MTWDRTTNQRIETLHPIIREDAEKVINTVESELYIKLRVTQALRTFKMQDDLYAQGRTMPGKIITYAKGGRSWHNYGLAFDVVEIIGKEANWNTKWDKIAEIAKRFGFDWGKIVNGSWDTPHFQKTFGLTIEQALDMHKQRPKGQIFININKK